MDGIPASRRRPPITGVWLCALALLALFAPGCSDPEPQRKPGPLRIAVDIPPMMSVVQALAPAGAETTLITPPGAPAHGYEPGPRAVTAVLEADLVVLSTRGLNPSIDRLLRISSNPEQVVIAMARIEHSHAASGVDDYVHAYEKGAHPWLEPTLMGEFAEVLGASIPREPGSPAAAGNERLGGFRALCAEIDSLYASRLQSLQGRGLVVVHDAWSDLAERYGFRIAAVIDLAEGAEPTPATIVNAAEALRSGEASAIAIEPQFAGRIADRLVELTGASVITLDPLGDGDWEQLMRSNLDALVEGLSADPNTTEESGAQ